LSPALINNNRRDGALFRGLTDGFFELFGFAAGLELGELVAHLEDLRADIKAQAAGNTFFCNPDFHKKLLDITSKNKPKNTKLNPTTEHPHL
jgi:hypothetical protein